MARRKSDKSKLKEGRGTGRGTSYIPWIFVGEFGSTGRATRVLGFKIRRVFHLLSDLEHYYFLMAHWSDDTVEIREQFPLLPLESTIVIAQELGIRHPSEKNKAGKEFVMTSDFVLTQKEGDSTRDYVRTIKPKGKINKRTKEKFRIEEEYWKRRGIEDWGIVTEKEIPKILCWNLKYLYQNYFWIKNMRISENEYQSLVIKFKHLLEKNDGDLNTTAEEFDEINNWIKGESWNFIENMILRKIAVTDIEGKRFTHYKLHIDFV